MNPLLPTDRPDPWPAYAAIAAVYGERRARRSGRRLMAHVDEGLYLLGVFGASPVELDAWCLHPLVQLDDDLRATWDRGADVFDGIAPRAVLLAMAYRETANAYLSGHARPAVMPHSPLPEVQRLLRADKVQNRKDFERHLRGDLPRSDRLDAYFGDWLAALGVSEARYVALAREIIARAGEPPAEVVPGAGGRMHLARVPFGPCNIEPSRSLCPGTDKT